MNLPVPPTRDPAGSDRDEIAPIVAPGPAVLVVLLAASSLTVMAGATIAPSLPGLARYFSDVPDAEFLARLALTLPALFIAITAPIMGLLVDRFGAQRILFGSTVIFVVGGASGAIVPDLYPLLVGRALLGVGVAGIMVATTTLIGGLYPAAARDSVLGYQGAAMALGGVVFLTAGGWLAEMNWRFPFYIYALPLLLLPFILTTLPNATPEKDQATERLDTNRMPWMRLGGLYLIALAAMTLFYIVPTQVPFRLVAAGFEDASLSGYAIAVSTFASAMTALLFGRIKAAIPATGALGLTFMGLGLGLLVTGISDNFLVIASGMLIAGAGAGLTMPTVNSLVLDTAPARGRGKATGGLSVSIFLGQFLSPILFAALSPATTIAGSFLWAGATALIVAVSFCVVLIVLRLRKSANQSDRKTKS
ncbi:MFS transporter [Gymnodinialimonas sp. 2305UL16-5]|uniref:MFS transporter n=1 Tax=Gymnodinialimonas mytili TaxID=3126503 RepID=UPI00309EE25F